MAAAERTRTWDFASGRHAQPGGAAGTTFLAWMLYPCAAMRHIIGILLQNEAGALNRVAGLFSTRGYNIESLSVAPTDDSTVSRITLVTRGSDAVIQQIVAQLNKLVDVVRVEDMTGGEHIERELALASCGSMRAAGMRCAATWCARADGCWTRPWTVSSSN